MKLDIKSAQEQVSGIVENDINSITKLFVEVDSLESIVESLDTDEYVNTRFNLDVILEHKLNEGFNLFLEVSGSDQLKSLKDMPAYIQKYMSFIRRKYAEFKENKKKILSNVKSNGTPEDVKEVSKLLKDIEKEVTTVKTLAQEDLDKIKKVGTAVKIVSAPFDLMSRLIYWGDGPNVGGAVDGVNNTLSNFKDNPFKTPASQDDYDNADPKLDKEFSNPKNNKFNISSRFTIAANCVNEVVNITNISKIKSKLKSALKIVIKIRADREKERAKRHKLRDQRKSLRQKQKEQYRKDKERRKANGTWNSNNIF